MTIASVLTSAKPLPAHLAQRTVASAAILVAGMFAFSALAATQSFTNPGQATYPVPAGTTLLKVTVAGGGGGGGGSDAGGTGGAGGAARKLSATLAVQGGETADVFVGAGGAHGVRQQSATPPTPGTTPPTPGTTTVGSGQGGAGGAAGAVGGGQYSGSGGSGGGASVVSQK